MDQTWIKREILTGFQKLLTLGLDRTPAAEVIPGTALTWIETITHRRVFDEAADTLRFREAFVALAGSCTQWPTPREFLDHLPAPSASNRLETRIVDEAARERSRLAAAKAINEIGELLHVKQPEDYPKPPPLAPVDDFPRCCEKGTREQPICDECRAWAQETHGQPRSFQTPEEESHDFLG